MSTDNDNLVARREAVVARGVAPFAGPRTVVSASGAIITDADGRILSARWGVPTLSELKRLVAGASR